MLIYQIINFDLYKMSDQIRYSGNHTNNPSNIAEHSYFVMLIADALSIDLKKKYENLDIDQGKVLKYALYHDVEEAYTGDIITPVKYTSDVLYKELEFVGEKLLTNGMKRNFEGNKHISENILESYKGYGDSKYDNIENMIVKFADQLEAFSYAVREINYGNKTFETILDSIITDIVKKWSKNEYFNEYIEALQRAYSEIKK